MKIDLPRPSDYHTHLRQGELLKTVAPYTAKRCGRALLMPNTQPPIVTGDHVSQYRAEAKAHLGDCEPVMVIKLMPYTTPEVIQAAFQAGAKAAKLYPEGVTNNSEDGIPGPWLWTTETKVANLLTPPQLDQPQISKNLQDSLGMMEQLGMVLCLHGEIPGEDTFTSPYDMKRHEHFYLPGQYDRIGKFLPWVIWVLTNYPKLKVVLEHITTRHEVNIIRLWSETHKIAATITAHHLLIRHEDIIGGKLKPHLFCKPIAKFEEDRIALCLAAQSGDPCFFLGTDNAPHPLTSKECEECCAGVWFPNWLEFLVGMFAAAGKIHRLGDFTSRFGDQFYDLPTVGGKIALVNETWRVPHEENGLKPFLGGSQLNWRME